MSTASPTLLMPLLVGINLLGALALDAFLPAFSPIAQSLDASPEEMQQTLSAFFLAFGVANLFVGPLADRWGRRPIVLGGILLNLLAFIACALVQTPGQLIAARLIQGIAGSAAVSITLAMIRDVHDAQAAQEAINRLVGFLMLGPILAPLVGSWLAASVGWRGLFMVLAALSLFLLAYAVRNLPETLVSCERKPPGMWNAMHGYRLALSNRRFVLLCVSFSAGFNGLFIYVLATPAFLGVHLGLVPTEYSMAFGFVILGSSLLFLAYQRLARGAMPLRVVGWGFTAMAGASIANLATNWAWSADISWALLPIVAYAGGFALVAAPMQVFALDVLPDQRGLAAALLATWVAMTNTAVAGLLVPLAMHSALALACASALLLLISVSAWYFSAGTAPHRPI